ncbi:MAG: dockerin type I repeat-containing protein [Chloroflexi bacterium]|nr:dockerin type I repeat-containing protein [Chloroflexota bacterium]MCI0856021.1 dockerin type I repeat-containing protein [Chloroflexota bacterium]MCI0890565.1 dockerin type I repeat-containing protein [Chloroflexota bacterium]
MSLSKQLGILIVSTLLALLVLAPGEVRDTQAGSDAPPNDDFADATEVTLLPFSDEVDVGGATVEEGERSCHSSGRAFSTVWYRFRPTEDAVLVAQAITEAVFAGLGVWTAANLDLQAIGCGGYSSPQTARVSFSAQAGTTYYFQVDQFVNEGMPSTAFSIKKATRPPHDDFANAKTITSLPYSEELNTGAATREPGESAPCLNTLFGGGSEATVWYTYTPEEDMVLIADAAGTDFRVFINVFAEVQGDLELLRCGMLGPSGELRLGVKVEAGDRYYLQVGGVRFGLEFGTLALELKAGVPPPNDDFAHAIVVDSFPFSAIEDTIAAALEPQEAVPTCGSSDFDLGSSIWYRISPEERSLIVFDTASDETFSRIGVYQGDSVDALTEVSCGGPAGFEALPGETYLLQIVSVGGGNVSIEVERHRMPACPPPDFTVMDQVGDVSDFGDPVTGPDYHDIVSTGVSMSEDDVCVHVTLADPFDPEGVRPELSIGGAVRIVTAPTSGNVAVASTCDRAQLRGVDLSFNINGQHGLLAFPSGLESDAPPFAVMLFDDETLTLAVPKAFLGGAESVRYAVWLLTRLFGVRSGADCAPDKSFIDVPPKPLGDANCDGRVNAIDSATVLQVTAALADYANCHYVADVDDDGTIGSIDAALILQLEAGLIDGLPGAH